MGSLTPWVLVDLSMSGASVVQLSPFSARERSSPSRTASLAVRLKMYDWNACTNSLLGTIGILLIAPR